MKCVLKCVCVWWTVAFTMEWLRQMWSIDDLKESFVWNVLPQYFSLAICFLLSLCSHSSPFLMQMRPKRNRQLWEIPTRIYLNIKYLIDANSKRKSLLKPTLFFANIMRCEMASMLFRFLWNGKRRQRRKRSRSVGINCYLTIRQTHKIFHKYLANRVHFHRICTAFSLNVLFRINFHGMKQKAHFCYVK